MCEVFNALDWSRYHLTSTVAASNLSQQLTNHRTLGDFNF